MREPLEVFDTEPLETKYSMRNLSRLRTPSCMAFLGQMQEPLRVFDAVFIGLTASQLG
jgi:hypothetical protein